VEVWRECLNTGQRNVGVGVCEAELLQRRRVDEQAARLSTMGLNEVASHLLPLLGVAPVVHAFPLTPVKEGSWGARIAWSVS
jgi:hypothetical protein